MTSFRTLLKIPPSSHKVHHQSTCWSIGSCFAENIGKQLLEDKFSIVLNPMGIIYNPMSVAQTIQSILDNRTLTETDLFEHESLWHSFLHHGSFSNADPNACLDHINQQLEQAKAVLPRLDTLLLTLGTAHCFKDNTTQNIVANCHRLPNQRFERIRLTPKQITDQLMTVLQNLKAAAPNTQVLLTVSPVRYLRDGLVASNRSKASLLLAVDSLCHELDFVSYFPAYELVTDELRDYRFFDTDMAHPNDLAVDYVYSKFQETYMTKETIDLTATLRQIKQAMAHRPRGLDTERHAQFKSQQLEKIKQLASGHAYLDLREEITYFEG